jgi:hypothetical protein
MLSCVPNSVAQKRPTRDEAEWRHKWPMWFDLVSPDGGAGATVHIIYPIRVSPQLWCSCKPPHSAVTRLLIYWSSWWLVPVVFSFHIDWVFHVKSRIPFQLILFTLIVYSSSFITGQPHARTWKPDDILRASRAFWKRKTTAGWQMTCMQVPAICPSILLK